MDYITTIAAELRHDGWLLHSYCYCKETFWGRDMSNKNPRTLPTKLTRDNHLTTSVQYEQFQKCRLINTKLLVVRFLALVTTMVTMVDHGNHRSNDHGNDRSNHRGYYDRYYNVNA